MLAPAWRETWAKASGNIKYTNTNSDYFEGVYFPDTYLIPSTETPEDVAKAVCFFCTSDSDYITGQVLNVDGGMLM